MSSAARAEEIVIGLGVDRCMQQLTICLCASALGSIFALLDRSHLGLTSLLYRSERADEVVQLQQQGAEAGPAPGAASMGCMLCQPPRCNSALHREQQATRKSARIKGSMSTSEERNSTMNEKGLPESPRDQVFRACNLKAKGALLHEIAR